MREYCKVPEMSETFITSQPCPVITALRPALPSAMNLAYGLHCHGAMKGLKPRSPWSLIRAARMAERLRRQFQDLVLLVRAWVRIPLLANFSFIFAWFLLQVVRLFYLVISMLSSQINLPVLNFFGI